ncbi:hypothetical protein L3X38_020868 [Prunus dulcis]|uniref:Transcriptional adapter n=1 Tax=Prunus dulcis TaxID=3755 RepID=A0AAD4Z219_PRUDU|nr:hypothetical protein L3X38_020868 [Prunus dulcis]
MGRSRGNFHSDEDPTQRSRRKKNASTGENLESSAAGAGQVRFIFPPLICPDWNADDENTASGGQPKCIGLGNWAEVAEHVGTKSKEQCIEHYTNVYLNSQRFPIPGMMHFEQKEKIERSFLLWLKGHGEDKKGFPMLGDHSLKEESPFSPSRTKAEDMHKGGHSSRLLSSINTDAESGLRSSGASVAAAAGNKKPSNMAQVKDGHAVIKVEEPQADRKGKKPSSLGSAGPFFSRDTDTEDERDLKLRVLRIYSKRLDERKRRKDFILERNLLYPNPFEKDLLPEERAICRRYDVFMCFHSKEEHEELLQTVIAEHRTMKRIQELKEARAAGCQSVDKDSNSRPAGQATSSSASDMDIMGFYGSDLLSEAEKRLCSEIRLPPPVFLKMQEVISIEIFSGNVSKKSDVHHLFKIEPSKIDRVYDMLVKKGITQP